MKTRRVVIIGCVTAFLLTACLINVFLTKVKERRPPNIIILLVDALRKDHMSLYGYPLKTTPEIDRFAQDALVFQDTISQASWTLPSVGSLFSSLYPYLHNAGTEDEQGQLQALNNKIIVLAEIVKEKGYRTAAFTANFFIGKEFQMHRGFDVLNHRLDTCKLSAKELNQAALQWIDAEKNKPFFVYVHYMDVHGPYNPPTPYDTFIETKAIKRLTAKHRKALGYLSAGKKKDKSNLNYYINRYNGALIYVDDQIGRLLKDLKKRKLLENSLVIITADHGEAFFEHGFFDHGNNLYNEEINIPLIIKFPDGMRCPDNTQRKVGLIDIVPTIAQILGYRLPYNIDGQDLCDPTGNEINPERRIFSELDYLAAMMKDDLKAVYDSNQAKITELYDRLSDKAEKENIYRLYPDKVKELQEEIASWITMMEQRKKKLGLRASNLSIEDEEILDQLRAVGYLQ